MGAWAVFHGAAMLLLDGQLQTAGVATGAEDAADFATSLVLENSTFVVAEAAEALDEAERRKDASHTEPARPVGKISYAAKLERDSDEEWDQRIGELGAAPVERQAPKEEAANEESGRLAETPTIYRALGATTGAVKRFLDPRTVRRIVSRSPALRRARRSLGVLSGSRVLWIDDRPNVNAAERRTLMALGVEVELAIDTVPALELIARRGHGPGGQAFDLIISDIARPDSRTAGIDALPLLRQLAPNTPVIFYVGTSDPNRDPPAGAFGLTTDPSELLHLVIDALERRRG
jgi:CheY-like chemotaxis protein